MRSLCNRSIDYRESQFISIYHNCISICAIFVAAMFSYNIRNFHSRFQVVYIHTQFYFKAIGYASHTLIDFYVTKPRSLINNLNRLTSSVRY